MTKTIIQAIEEFKLDIARVYYSGARYISNKQTIADSFRHVLFTEFCGAIEDETNGRVWVVYLGPSSEWRYSFV